MKQNDHFSANLDDIFLERHPKSSVFFITNNIGRVHFGFFRLGLIESDNRFGIGPATDKYFNHWAVDGIAAQQGDVRIVFTLDVEC